MIDNLPLHLPKGAKLAVSFKLGDSKYFYRASRNFGMTRYVFVALNDIL
jgi:hypothetical protein